MRFQAILPFAILLSASPVTSSETGDVWDLVSNLPREPSGERFIHLGDDGVLRSFSGSGDVIAYRQLDPEQINQYISRFPSPDKEHLLEVYKGVDGRSITEITQLAHPNLELLLPEAEVSASNSSNLHHLSESTCYN
ncbi:hypothetical protein V6Z88_002003 [Aspergillus fumigatus]